MATTDFLSSLGAGASFSTKEVVNSLVEAERAPLESRIQKRIDSAETEISGLAKALSSLNTLKAATDSLKDATDYDDFSVTNSQATAITVDAGAGADVGNHSVTVAAIAKAQTTNLMQSGSAKFTSQTQLLNGGSSFVLNIQIGGGSGVNHPITVSTDTPQGITDAINSADIGIVASLIDTGTDGSDYIIQMTGEQGTAKSFTVTEASTSLLSNSIPSGFSAADASLSVNGISFTRATNNINDILPGVTLNLNSTTTGAAAIALTRDTTQTVSEIVGFVEAYNTTKKEFDALTSSELDGELRGDIVIRSSLRDIKSILTNISSTPGSNLTRLSDLGISINKGGTFDINETKLGGAIASNFSDIKKIFSAGTTDQSDVGTASRGIAGDLSKIIGDLQRSDGYFTTRTATLSNHIDDDREALSNLDERMVKLQERYERQFLSMQKIIDQMDNTRENLISSFENLPFTNRD